MPGIEAIGQARHSINMECYIFRADETGRKFMTAMIERARAGVIVTLVVDAVGIFRFGLSAIRNREMSARLTRDVRHDLKSCEEVTLTTWRQRPLFEKIVEPFAWILERQQ